ncbi:hypothetical protein [Gemmatimonas sp.]|uniref:hypothetical protein n=1 Tax=Gemmatimonas sp. TaxID=1962908 RepID=UPI002ED91CC6
MIVVMRPAESNGTTVSMMGVDCARGGVAIALCSVPLIRTAHANAVGIPLWRGNRPGARRRGRCIVYRKIGQGESDEEAIARELCEELGGTVVQVAAPMAPIVDELR